MDVLKTTKHLYRTWWLEAEDAVIGLVVVPVVEIAGGQQRRGVGEPQLQLQQRGCERRRVGLRR